MANFLNRFTLISWFFLMLLPHFLKGGEGDTLQVIAHNRAVVVTNPSKGVRDHRAWAVFPGKETAVRKITMHVTFGCPDSLRCADWDYSDRIQIERVGGVNGKRIDYELGRLITPYGGFFARTWSFDWEIDVTDFSLLLRDSVEINYIHSGYEPANDRGWLVTILFDVVKGTPALEPLAITKVWDDHFAYGNPEKPIDSTLYPFSFVPLPNADLGRLRVIQTGHGMDRPDNCAEFCSRYREFWFDGKLVDRKQLWKKCGWNPVYPQAGTWIFDRGNWCPGNLMDPEVFHLPLQQGKTHTLKFVMEPYTATHQNNGNQVISAYLIQYKTTGRPADVTLEDIEAPTGKDLYKRMNPVSFTPVIRVRNSGSDTLKSMKITYGTPGGTQIREFAWKGTIPPLQQERIELPGAIDGRGSGNRFFVTLGLPNGKPDAWPADNRLEVTFTAAPVHGNTLVFSLLTNNQPEQNGWKLLSSEGKVIQERKPGSMKAAAEYSDTFRLAKGAYQLVFSDTEGDGLEFWYNTKGGRGEARLTDGNGLMIKAFEPDCGSGWVYSFTVGNDPDQVDPNLMAASLYPTRTSEKTTFRYYANQSGDLKIKLITDPGDVVAEERNIPAVREGNFEFDLRRFPYGRFYLIAESNGKEVFKRRIRYVEPPKEEFPYEWPADTLVKAKLETWQDWKFGVIIHWGPYSEWGVVESWSLCPEDESWCIRRGPYADDYYRYVKEYEKIREQFNPVDFQPELWAKACRNAGMKYVVFTTKHHDGFSMFDTRQTDYRITHPDSRFASDPRSNITAGVFDAFRNEGLAAGVYFSKPDWHSEDYWWPYFPVTDRNINYDPKKYPERWKRFQEFTYHQLEELMTGYGKVDILWLDGGWVRPEGSLTEETKPWLGKNQYVQDIGMDRIAHMARQHQPGLLIVDRTVHGEYENYRTPEQQIPVQKPDYPWESCITLGGSWYHTGPGEKYKSSYWVVHTLAKIVAKGGNLLLGIGPDKTGALPPEVYKVLEETGNWMKINGEAIYMTHPLAPFQEGNFCFTQSTDSLYQYAIYLCTEGESLPARLVLPEGFATGLKTVMVLGYPDPLPVGNPKNAREVILPKALLAELSGTQALVFRK